MTDTVRSADGTTIAFDRSGAGPALIVVGGALSERSAAADIAAHLALVVHRLSRSTGAVAATAATRQPYAVEREIEDIAALIEQAGGSAFVFGHSSGAVLSLRAAAAGLAIPRLALYEPPFIVDHSRPLQPPEYVEHLDGAAGRRPPRGCRRVLHDRVGRRAAAGRRRDAQGPLVVRSRGARPHDPVRRPGHGRHDERQPGAAAASGRPCRPRR